MAILCAHKLQTNISCARCYKTRFLCSCICPYLLIFICYSLYLPVCCEMCSQTTSSRRRPQLRSQISRSSRCRPFIRTTPSPFRSRSTRSHPAPQRPHRVAAPKPTRSNRFARQTIYQTRDQPVADWTSRPSAPQQVPRRLVHRQHRPHIDRPSRTSQRPLRRVTIRTGVSAHWRMHSMSCAKR